MLPVATVPGRCECCGPTDRNGINLICQVGGTSSSFAVKTITVTLSPIAKASAVQGTHRPQFKALMRACHELAGGSGRYALHYHVESGFDAAKTELLREIYHAIHSQHRWDSQSLIHCFRVLRHRSAFATPDLPTCPVRQLQRVCRSSCQNSHIPRERS